MRRIAVRLAATLSLAAAVGALVLAGAEQPPDYFPLDAGRQWHYRVLRTTMDGATGQVHVVRNVPGRVDDGRTVVARVSSDGSRHYFARADDGVHWMGSRRRDGSGEPRPAPMLALPLPARPGVRWQTAGRTLVLEKTGPPQETLYRLDVEVPMTYTVVSTTDDITVPAGRYTGCLRVEGRGVGNANVRNYLGNTRVEVETVDWYAPGVGLVRAERRERTDKAALDAGDLRLELVEMTRR